MDSQPSNDPIDLSRKIINGHPEHWGPGADNEILGKFRLQEELATRERMYLLLESPGLTLDFSLTGTDSEKHLSKALLLELLKEAASAPGQTSRQIARATLQQGLAEYDQAFRIAGNYRKSKNIGLDEAISFLDNRYGYAKLEDAKKLLEQASESAVQPIENKEINARLKAISKGYPNQIPITNALTEIHEFFKLLEEANIGLAAFEPYTAFRNTMEQLNRSRIAQRRTYRSTIAISEPNSGSVWTLSEPVSLKWSTTNIPEDKSLRFFLVDGDMVVQELGTFRNTGEAKGIHLNKNIDSGDHYKVVGIELFPANKYYIAKLATPAFSIRRPERKTVTDKGLPEAPAAAATLPETERMSFEGRKISYVKELTVNNDAISIRIWDHGRQDRDIVSIYLNGDPVVHKHYLTYDKKHFEVQLDANKKNDLFLYAHNLGFYPPNTVSIEIVDGTSSENIVLNSDLESCEAVLINVKQ